MQIQGVKNTNQTKQIWMRVIMSREPMEDCLKTKKQRNITDLSIIMGKTFSNNKTKMKLMTIFIAKIQKT